MDTFSLEWKGILRTRRRNAEVRSVAEKQKSIRPRPDAEVKRQIPMLPCLPLPRFFCSLFFAFAAAFACLAAMESPSGGTDAVRRHRVDVLKIGKGVEADRRD
jgi:hypothetical protein